MGALLIQLGACNSPTTGVTLHSEAGAPAACGPNAAIVAVTSDYKSSELGTLGLDGGTAFYSAGATLGEDPALAISQGRVFFIDRTGGNVLELDPSCGTLIAGPWLTNDDLDGGGSIDPQDLAVSPLDGSVWVARYFVPSVLVKSSDGATVLGHIDLSHVVDPPRNPYMSAISIVDSGDGPKAYVALEMLDPYPDGIQPSMLVKLDVKTALTTGKIEAMLVLKGRNPFGQMVQDGNTLYIAEPGAFDAGNETNAGIEQVDLTTFTSELVVRESDLGASVDQISIGGGCGTAILAGPQADYNPTSLVSFMLDGGAFATPPSAAFLATDAGFFLAGMARLPEAGLTLVGDQQAIAGKGFAVHAVAVSADCTMRIDPRPLFVPEEPVAIVPATN